MTAAELIDQLERLRGEFAAVIEPLSDEQEIRAAQAQFLGKKGQVSALMRELGKLPAADKPLVGEVVNRVKGDIEAAVQGKLAELVQRERARDLARTVDVTLPGRARGAGPLHLLTQVRLEAIDIFAELGFAVAEGPQVETDWHTFEALAIPKDHPARDMQDTFYVSDEIVLRTHTSPVQIRTMQTQKPPIRIVAPGVVFRRDDDPTHSPMFTQIEGLAVDVDIRLSDLKGVLLHFVRRFFEKELDVRFRPSYFPFVEPGAEVDMQCVFCLGSGRVNAAAGGGAGCRVCKGTGWVEIGGSGMVDPEVFANVGIDSEKYTGFAFGMGLERMAMLRHGVNDIKYYYEGDLRFLEQFRVKILWSWLLELCDLDRAPTVEEASRALTGAGLEIEGLAHLGGGFSGVVVAEVVGKRPHPNAEKLTLVDVITERGGAATQVVCGAPNVPAPGMRVLWARPGATLPGGMTLGVKPVKGIESPGMLCSAKELGVDEDGSGIIVLDPIDAPALGAPAQEPLFLADWVLEVNVPANRGDCLGHLGLARELTALLGGRVAVPAPVLEEFEIDGGPACTVEIADPAGCPRYTGRTIDGVTVRPAPRRMQQRLRAVGVRPISNLVDVSNYVMFELGQPLHAFDWHTVKDAKILVRRARAGESMKTLDGIERALLPDDLLICDAARPIALAGVMGGLDTEVTDATRRVLLEAASFDGRSVRRTARRLALHSEASQRFGRGVDPAVCELASARAAELLARLGGGKILRGVADQYASRGEARRVPLRIDRARALTGVDLDSETCRRVLERLGMTVSGERDLEVEVPSARPDVTREVDLIEEVMRVAGLDRVPATLPSLRAAPVRTADARADRARVKLASCGLAEAITFAFQSTERLANLRLPASDRRAAAIALRNPMSVDQAILRTSLLPNLLAAVARNRSFGVADVALFEVGSVFLRRPGQPPTGEITELADEPVHACVVLSGGKPRHLADAPPWDFFDAKGIAETMVPGARFVAATDIPYLHPGVAARIELGGEACGELGEVHPDTRLAFGIEAPVFVLDLELAALPAHAIAQMRAIPRFPSTTRDVSLLCADAVAAAQVGAMIEAASQPLVESYRILEDYRGDRLPPGHKSQLWSITYRAADRTLTDAEVEAAHEAIVAQLLANLPAQRR